MGPMRILKVRKGDIDRIIDIERSWHHLSHWSIDSYYRLLNDDSFTSSFVAEIIDEGLTGFVVEDEPVGFGCDEDVAEADLHSKALIKSAPWAS